MCKPGSLLTQHRVSAVCGSPGAVLAHLDLTSAHLDVESRFLCLCLNLRGGFFFSSRREHSGCCPSSHPVGALPLALPLAPTGRARW